MKSISLYVVGIAVLLTTIIASLGGLVYVFITTVPQSSDIPATASVTTDSNVPITWDITGTQVVEHINFGVLDPGENKTVIVYVTNNAASEVIGTMLTSSWVPSAAGDFISLSWNFGSVPLSPNRIRKVELTLNVSPDIHGVTDFYFMINFTFA